MRMLIILSLLAGLTAAEEATFSTYTVVYYHVDEAVEGGEPVERTRSLILSRVEEVVIGDATFLTGVVPDDVGSEVSGARIHVRADRVYLLMGSDSKRAAKVLREAARQGVWRQVEE